MRTAGRSTAAQRERGQASVELVLVLPLVAVLILAGVQVGLVVRDRLLLAHVAREAARSAAVQPEPAAAASSARGATSLDPDRLTVTLGPTRAPGDRLAVTVTYRSPTSVPLVGHLVGDVIMTSEVTVRVE
jgi:Flp pilus assembly protein TadG